MEHKTTGRAETDAGVVPSNGETKSLTHDVTLVAATVVANNVIGPVLAQATEKLLHRPPEPVSQIVLPPGVNEE